MNGPVNSCPSYWARLTPDLVASYPYRIILAPTEELAAAAAWAV
jgi:hypothetical protein